MSKMFNDLKEGLENAIKDARSKEKFLRRTIIEIQPLIDYKPQEIKDVRHKVGMTQKLFANYLGVSVKTVESWESGLNKPSGSSNRLITMLNLDKRLVKQFPFVYTA